MSLPARLAFGALLFLVGARATAAVEEPKAPPAAVTFDKDIAPLLSARCQPCHYPGGKMYSKLPFDRAETIRTLGTKLFTRIKDEKDQALIRAFLAAEPAPPPVKAVPSKH